jgi:hypothetical protein
VNGERRWRDMQAGDVFEVQQIICREFDAPFRPI